MFWAQKVPVSLNAMTNTRPAAELSTLPSTLPEQFKTCLRDFECDVWRSIIELVKIFGAKN